MGVIGDMASGEVLRSIFGGPVSTRAFCAVVVPKHETEPAPAALKQRDKHVSGSIGGSKGGAGAPAPSRAKPVDPKVLRKKQIQADLDLFEDLATDGPAKIAKPKPKLSDPEPAGPGPSSTRVNRATRRPLQATTTPSGTVKASGGGSAASNQARDKAPGTATMASSGMRPALQLSGSRANGAAASGTATAAKARPGAPAPTANGTVNRTPTTNHQRLGASAGASKPGGGGTTATAPGHHTQPRGSGRNSAAVGGPSTSGRPNVVGAKPGAAGAGSRPGAAAAATGGAKDLSGPARIGVGAGASSGGGALKRPMGQLSGGELRRDGGGIIRKPAPRRPREEDEYEKDFVVNDEDEGQDWRKFLRRTTGYDPSRYRDDQFDDRMMEASWRQVVEEEKRSARMGRMEDEMAEVEEERHRREKIKRLKSTKKQRTD